jgi:hypothetical protein
VQQGVSYVDDMIRGLTARPHKLTSLDMNRQDVLQMDIDEAHGHLDWIARTREREIEQYKKEAEKVRTASRSR